MSLLRSILGVVIGYLIFAASAFAFFQLTGIPPHGRASFGIMLASALVGVAAAWVGGYLAASIAGRYPVLHARIVAAIVALGAAISLAMTIGHGAIWSQVAALALMAPAAEWGGRIRALRQVNLPGGAPRPVALPPATDDR